MRDNPNISVSGFVRTPRHAPDHTLEYASYRPIVSKKAEIYHIVMICLLGLCGCVDLLRSVGVGGISGLGLMTIFGCGAAWAAWLARPFLPNDLLKVVLPLMMFETYTTGSLL